jgi:hypothetical protein
MKQTRNRRTGYIVAVEPSKSAGYYTILKDSERTVYFGYGRSFLSHPVEPRVGQAIEFTPLPPGSGRLPRATEIVIQRPSRGGALHVERDDIGTRLVLRSAGQSRTLGEIARNEWPMK